MLQNSLFISDTKKGEVIVPKELFEWYCENSNDQGVVIWNKGGDIVCLSTNFNIYTKVREEILLGESLSQVFHQSIITKITEYFMNQEDQLEILNQTIQNSDDLFNLHISQLSIQQETYFICQLKNKTHIHQLENTIVDREKSILAAQLAAGLVHDIRNPLTSLRGFLQLVQAGVKQKEEFYRVMIGEIDKLEKITDELLQVSKPFSDEKKKENLCTLIEDVAFVMEYQSKFSHINLQIACEGDLICFCNATQIKQILINLVLNAMESMEQKGTVILRAYQSNDSIKIDIIDEGTGVEEGILKELNEPFFTTKKTGTGLGLAITQHLLELHRAQLYVRNNKGRGSTFTIELPIE